MSSANKKYSDRLFHFLFGKEEHKDWTLSLYNAVRGSSYTDKDDIQIIENIELPEAENSLFTAKLLWYTERGQRHEGVFSM